MPEGRRFLVTLLIEVDDDEADPVDWDWNMILDENRTLIISQSDQFDRRLTFLEEEE